MNAASTAALASAEIITDGGRCANIPSASGTTRVCATPEYKALFYLISASHAHKKKAEQGQRYNAGAKCGTY
jgi:hypothetical protein